MSNLELTPGERKVPPNNGFGARLCDAILNELDIDNLGTHDEAKVLREHMQALACLELKPGQTASIIRSSRRDLETTAIDDVETIHGGLMSKFQAIVERPKVGQREQITLSAERKKQSVYMLGQTCERHRLLANNKAADKTDDEITEKTAAELALADILDVARDIPIISQQKLNTRRKLSSIVFKAINATNPFGKSEADNTQIREQIEKIAQLNTRLSQLLANPYKFLVEHYRQAYATDWYENTANALDAEIVARNTAIMMASTPKPTQQQSGNTRRTRDGSTLKDRGIVVSWEEADLETDEWPDSRVQSIPTATENAPSPNTDLTTTNESKPLPKITLDISAPWINNGEDTPAEFEVLATDTGSYYIGRVMPPNLESISSKVRGKIPNGETNDFDVMIDKLKQLLGSGIDFFGGTLPTNIKRVHYSELSNTGYEDLVVLYCSTKKPNAPRVYFTIERAAKFCNDSTIGRPEACENTYFVFILGETDKNNQSDLIAYITGAKKSQVQRLLD